MNKSVVFAVVFVAALAGIVAIGRLQPPRLTQARLEQSIKAQEDLDRIDAMRAEAEANAESEAEKKEEEGAQPESGESVPAQTESAIETSEEEDGVFKIKFDTSKGEIIMAVHPEWAPIGAERIREMVEKDFFKNVKFFRVVTQPRPFVVQFGIAADPEVGKGWRDRNIKDEPVKHSNTRGTVTFAKSNAPNSRTTQLFINLGSNTALDKMGFAPVGEIVEGMDVVDRFNDEYQDKPTAAQQYIHEEGNAFLDDRYPGLDYIKSATILEDNPEG